LPSETYYASNPNAQVMHSTNAEERTPEERTPEERATYTLQLDAVQAVALDNALAHEIDSNDVTSQPYRENLRGIKLTLSRLMWGDTIAARLNAAESFYRPDLDSHVKTAMTDFAGDLQDIAEEAGDITYPPDLTANLQPLISDLIIATMNRFNDFKTRVDSHCKRTGRTPDAENNQLERLNYLANQLNNARLTTYSFRTARETLARLIDMAYMAAAIDQPTMYAYNARMWDCLTIETTRLIERPH
jgi:hypothetical protein